MINYVNLSQLIHTYYQRKRRTFEYKMNVENLCHHTNLAETKNSEYTKGDVRGSIPIDSSVDSRCKQSLPNHAFYSVNNVSGALHGYLE
jgi:hypothetical protein